MHKLFMRPKVLKDWHWISSAVCLVGILLFSLTGITLNHASQIEATPSVVKHSGTLQAIELKQLLNASGGDVLPSLFTRRYQQIVGQEFARATELEWNDYELYGLLAKPGGDHWFSVDLTTGDFYGETTDRGWVAYFNDLHKARNTGILWSLFIDIFAVACIVFTITGLLLLKKYSKGRKSTWPLVLAGLIIPWLAVIGSAHAADNQLTIEIPRPSVAEYHPPYLAVWLANDKQQSVADVAVWYDQSLSNREGEKWLKDLRQWWRRSGRLAELPLDGISGATRRPGTQTIDLSWLLPLLAKQPTGNYYLYIEAARELGGRELLRVPLSLPLTSPISQSIEGQHELGHITLNLEPEL